MVTTTHGTMAVAGLITPTTLMATAMVIHIMVTVIMAAAVTMATAVITATLTMDR